MSPIVILIILTLVAVLLFAAEVFVPGGILGIIGGACLLAACGYAIFAFKTTGMLVALCLIIVAIAGFLVWMNVMPKTALGKRFALSHTLEEPEEAPSPLLGKTGEAETDLRPGGFARIDGRRIDVVAQRGYVEKGTRVEVLEVHGSRVVVRPVEEA